MLTGPDVGPEGIHLGVGGGALGPAKTYNLGLSERSARALTIQIVGGTGAIKRVSCNQKGPGSFHRVLGFPYRASGLLAPYRAIVRYYCCDTP